MYKEKRDVLEIRKIDKCNMEKMNALGDSEKTIANLGDRWPQKAKQEENKVSKKFPCSI